MKRQKNAGQSQNQSSSFICIAYIKRYKANIYNDEFYNIVCTALTWANITILLINCYQIVFRFYVFTFGTLNCFWIKNLEVFASLKPSSQDKILRYFLNALQLIRNLIRIIRNFKLKFKVNLHLVTHSSLNIDIVFY